MDRDFILDESKKYLKMTLKNNDVEKWDDDQILMMVNRLYFGGIQAFARQKKREKGISLNNGIH